MPSYPAHATPGLTHVSKPAQAGVIRARFGRESAQWPAPPALDKCRLSINAAHRDVPLPLRSPRLHFDLTTVQLFIAVAELGGITRGAERLHLAPAAASRRVLELEAQLGVALFERLPHGMALTEAGRALLAHARGITHTVQRMQDDAASFIGGDLGVVRIAAPKSAVIQFLPFDIQRCASACPGVRIDLQEMNSLEVQQSCGAAPWTSASTKAAWA